MLVAEDDPRLMVKCRDCSGHGWTLYRCERGSQVSTRDPFLPRRVCERMGSHVAHTYTLRCVCSPRASQDGER